MEKQLTELIDLVERLSIKVNSLEKQVQELKKPRKKTESNSDRNSWELSEEAKEARRIAHREWQRENREKTREYQIRHWENKVRNININIDFE